MVDQELIATFMDISGCDKVEDAQNYLSFGEGDLETAIQLYLASKDAPGNTVKSYSAGGSDFSQQVMEEDVRAPIAPKRETLSESFTVHGQGFRGYSNLEEDWGAPSSSSSTRAGPRFRQSNNDKFERLFALPTDIMFDGPFELACKAAVDKDKWLMLTIHMDSEFPCQILNRDLWKDPSVKEIVKENFVFVQYEHDTPDGREHINYYHFDQYPYIAILDPLTKERVKLWNTAISPDEFMMDVLEFISSKAEIVPPKKKKAAKKEIGMLTEEEQMELAIKASMDGQSVQNLVDAQEDEIEDVTPVKPTEPKSIFESIARIEKSKLVVDPSNKTRVRFKFPDGQLVTQEFSKSALISDLFGFVKGSFSEQLNGPFDLIHVREPLLKRWEETLDQAKLLTVQLTIDYL